MIFGSVFRALVRNGYPIVTPIIRDVYRIKGIVRFGLIPLARSLSWYFRSNEYTNFTYDISEKSEKYLSAFLANALDASREETISYLNEVKEDAKLREHFLELVPRTEERYFADLPIRYGRRVGWYVLLRILKPRIVVESGVDRGIGTCVLARISHSLRPHESLKSLSYHNFNTLRMIRRRTIKNRLFFWLCELQQIGSHNLLN